VQVVLVYIQPFRRNSLLKCVSQHELQKTTKTPYCFGFNVIQGR